MRCPEQSGSGAPCADAAPAGRDTRCTRSSRSGAARCRRWENPSGRRAGRTSRGRGSRSTTPMASCLPFLSDVEHRDVREAFRRRLHGHARRGIERGVRTKSRHCCSPGCEESAQKQTRSSWARLRSGRDAGDMRHAHHRSRSALMKAEGQRRARTMRRRRTKFRKAGVPRRPASIAQSATGRVVLVDRHVHSPGSVCPRATRG